MTGSHFHLMNIFLFSSSAVGLFITYEFIALRLKILECESCARRKLLIGLLTTMFVPW